jgi:type IV secretory pathway TrbD component
MSGPGPQDLAADVARQRDELARTVEALQAKLDFRSRARHRVSLARARALTPDGKPRPVVLVAGTAAVAVAVGFVAWRWSR